MYVPNHYKATDLDHLELLIHEAMQNNLNNSVADLNYIDVSEITNMTGLFFRFKHRVDVSKWDVSNVTNMRGTFEEYIYNIDISNWDVSKVDNMESMFKFSSFNGDISKWDVSNVECMASIFSRSDFTGDISSWDVSKVEDVTMIFNNTNHSFDISKWNITKCTTYIDDLVETDDPVLIKFLIKGYNSNVILGGDLDKFYKSCVAALSIVDDEDERYDFYKNALKFAEAYKVRQSPVFNIDFGCDL